MKRIERILLFAVVVGIALIMGSCALGLSGEASLVIPLSGSSARALSDSPVSINNLRFSGFTLRVSGPGMESVEFTYGEDASSLSATVPAGSNRTIELYAPVDWVAIKKLLPANTPMPELVIAYGATTTVDLAPGKTTTVNLRLQVADTKILLPDASSGDLYTGMDINSTISVSPLVNVGPSIFDVSTDFAFDRYGQLFSTLYYSAVNILTIDGLTGLGSFSSLVLTTGNDIAFDYGRNRLYFFYDGDGTVLNLYNLVDGSSCAISEPVGYTFAPGSIAVDGEGNVLVPADYDSDLIDPNNPIERGILKLSIPATVTADFTATYNSFRTLEDMVIGYYPDGFSALEIRDMMVIGNKLYVLAGNDFSDQGKLVECTVTDLGYIREMGWSEGTPSNLTGSLFYGPQRFVAIKPRKLVFLDEDLGNSVNRVVEVDIPSWTVSGIGFEDAGLSFLTTYIAY